MPRRQLLPTIPESQTKEKVSEKRRIQFWGPGGDVQGTFAQDPKGHPTRIWASSRHGDFARRPCFLLGCSLNHLCAE